MKKPLVLILVFSLLLQACTPFFQSSDLSARLDETIHPDYFGNQQPLIIHFSQPMDPASTEAPLIFVPAIRGELVWDDAATTLTFTPASVLREGSVLRVTISPDLLSAAGQAFEDLPAWEIRRPYATSVVRREPGGILFADDLSFTLKFVAPIDHQRVEELLTVEPDVPLELNWKGDSLTIHIRPETATQGDEYTFKLPNLPLDAGIWDQSMFWTYKVPGITATLSYSAAEGLDSPARLAFSAPMETSSVEGAISLSPTIDYDLAWEDGDQTLLITLTEGLEPGQTSQVSFDQPVRTQLGIEDTLSQPFAFGPPDWEVKFDTSISGTQPRIQYTFSIPPSIESFKESFRISPEVDFEVVGFQGLGQVSVKILEPLPANKLFTLVFTQPLTDINGNRLGLVARQSYLTPPPITNLRPNYGAAESVHHLELPVLPSDAIVIEFSRDMDAQSTEAALTLESPLAVVYTWKTPRILHIRPAEGDFEQFSKLIIQLEVTALDSQGLPLLEEPFQWEVQFKGALDAYTFGYGASVQVVDPDGPRLVQVGKPFNSAPATEIALELFPLNRVQLAEFLEYTLENPEAWWSDGTSNPLWDSSGLSVIRRWNMTNDELNSTLDGIPGSLITLPSDLEQGVYLLNLNTGHTNDQLAIVLSSAALQIKVGREIGDQRQLTVWLNDISGGYVLPGATVRVYDAGGRLLAEGLTDGSGTFSVELSSEVEPYFVIASRDEIFALSGIGDYWRTWNSNYYGYYSESRSGLPTHNDYHAYIYTDRPIYQPGQQVFYKAVLRLDYDADYRLPPRDREVIVRIRDGRGNLLETAPATLNAFGTLNGGFQIPEAGMLGEYSIEVDVDGELHSEVFSVQEYTKPDMQITLTPANQDVLLNQSVDIALDAQYLFGQPVAGAALTVNFYELAPESYAYSYDYSSAGDDLGDDYIWFKSGSPTVRLTTDLDGSAQISFKAPEGRLASGYYLDDKVSSYRPPFLLGVEVTLDDGSAQPQSTFTVIRVHTVEFEPILETGRLYLPGDRVPVHGRLQSDLGSAVAGQELILSVQKRAGGYWSWERAIEYTLVTDEAGNVQMDLELEEGHYRLRLGVESARGDRVVDTSYVNVWDPGGTVWAYFTSELEIQDDSTVYQVGDVAELYVETSYTGQAWLTIERGHVLDHRLVQLSAPGSVIRVPILEGYAPDVFVTIQTWRPQDMLETLAAREDEYYSENIPEARLLDDTIRLEVDDSSHLLTVSLASDQGVYGPGDSATFEVQVNTVRGQPVAAEVSLALVDESIFLLADDPALPIHDAYYQDRPLSVLTSDSMSPWRILSDGGGMGGGGGGYELEPGEVRSDFPDTVIWLPEVVTDASGHATLTVQLPDTLTTWRLTAKAVTLRTQIGQGELKIITRKEVVMRPVLPGVLTVGDTTLISAAVHNYTNDAQTFEVRLDAQGLTLDEEARLITIPAGGAEMVVWQISATRAGEAALLFSASSEAGSDAIESVIPVQPYQIEEWSAQAGLSGSDALVFTNAGDALYGSVLTVEINRTAAGSLLNGLDYLTGFPYGCVEQTMSRALPNAVIAQAYRSLGQEERLSYADMEAKLKASVTRLYALQHDDGGWGWWFDDRSDEYQTAWVLFGLSVIRQSGHPVAEQVLENGANYLVDHMAEMDLRTRAFALYAMAEAGLGDDAETLMLFDLYPELDTFSASALALALERLGHHEQALIIAVELSGGLAVEADGSLYVPGIPEDGYYHLKTMASEVRSNALLLKMLLAVQPDSPAIAGLAQWLMQQRKAQGWGTTNETAFSILALADYLLTEQTGGDAQPFTVSINGRVIESGTLEAGQDQVVLSYDLKGIRPGEFSLLVASPGEKPLHVVASTHTLTAESLMEGAGIQVERLYLDPVTKLPLNAIQVGDLVLVRLSIQMPEEAYYVQVRDALPAGFTAINENLNISSHEATAVTVHRNTYGIARYLYEDLGYNYKEIRAGEVSFFITAVEKGKLVLEYYVRASQAGEFNVLPAEIVAMYDPETWGRSGAGEVLIVP